MGPSRREAVNGGLARVSVMLAKGNNEDALDIAQHVLERESTRSVVQASIPQPLAAL